jgi:ATP-binding cassette, subfamily B, bacterial
VILESRDLTVRRATRTDPILRTINLRICEGDRILLQGPSGSGKSTLAAVLSAGQSADSGSILLDGLDRNILGTPAWRRRVALVPQFNENHVLLGSFSFNLLMGCRWPPQRSDMERALEVCRALGLGPLLDRMPGGLEQMVGETGWQLSHGERSRLFVARALLQESQVLIFDESFAALDPETLRLALTAVLERAPTIMVISHP